MVDTTTLISLSILRKVTQKRAFLNDFASIVRETKKLILTQNFSIERSFSVSQFAPHRMRSCRNRFTKAKVAPSNVCFWISYKIGGSVAPEECVCNGRLI